MFGRLLTQLKGFFRHRLFFSFYFPSFLFAIALGVRIPILPLYASELSSTYFLIGLVVGGAGLGTLAADLPAGAVLRRMDKRMGMMLGIALDAISTLALIWVDDIWMALGLRIISGFGISILSVARHAFISEAVSIKKRGRALSLFGGLMRIGLFIGPAVGGLFASAFGVRLPFLIYFLMCVLAVAALLLARDRGTQSESTHAFNSSAQVGLLQSLKGRWGVFTSASAAHVLAQITRAGQRLILPLYAADVLMLEPDQIGFVVSLSSAVSMTLFYPVGLIMDHLGRKVAIIPSFVLMGLGLALMPLTANYGHLLMVAALIGLGHGLGSGAMMTLGADLSPARGRSSFLGAWRWIGDAGNSAGPLVVGWVADAVALPSAAMLISGAGFLAAVVFGVLVPETLKKDRNQAI